MVVGCVEVIGGVFMIDIKECRRIYSEFTGPDRIYAALGGSAFEDSLRDAIARGAKKHCVSFGFPLHARVPVEGGTWLVGVNGIEVSSHAVRRYLIGLGFQSSSLANGNRFEFWISGWSDESGVS